MCTEWTEKAEDCASGLAAQFSDDAELNIHLQDVMQAIPFLLAGNQPPKWHRS